MKHKAPAESDFLCSHPLFSGLPEKDLQFFKQSMTIKQYKKNSYIYHQADHANRFFMVFDGWVRLFRETFDGDETVTSLMKRGDIFGEGILFYKNSGYIFSAQAVEPTCLIEIPKNILRYRAENNPDITRRILSSICEKMILLQTENEQLAHMSTTQRVACLLLRLSSHMVGNGGTFTFPYDKSIAALQLGMKRETFSRALMQLRNLGVHVNGSEIKIESFQKLNDFSCTHCSLSAGECKGARCTTPCTFENLQNAVASL